jgi:hypothetical protein
MSEPKRREAQQPDSQRAEADEEERRFVDDLLVRGEAVPEGSDPLPPGATHEVVEKTADGKPRKVRRRRFSAG